MFSWASGFSVQTGGDQFGWDGTAVFGQGDDDGSAWWAGTAKCFANVGLAVLLASNALAATLPVAHYQQDEVPQVSQIVEEPEIGVFPVPQLNPAYRAALFDQEEIPAGNLFGQDDEDFWQNPVAPQVWSIRRQDPTVFEQHENAAGLYGQTEEELWQNQVPPQAWAIRRQDPSVFDQHENAAGLYGQAEEEFWVNAVKPITGAIGPLLAFQDAEDVPHLYGVPEEVGWWVRTPRWTWESTRFIPIPDETRPTPVASMVEDSEWWSMVRPSIWSPPIPFIYTDGAELVPPIRMGFRPIQVVLRGTATLVRIRGTATLVRIRGTATSIRER